MKKRCRVEMHGPVSVRHPVIEVLNIRQHVGVRNHDTLWVTGRAAGVDEG